MSPPPLVRSHRNASPAHRRLVPVVLAALALLALPAHGNVFGKDGRSYKPATGPVLRAVGMLSKGERQVGSAFLVGECHAVTAHHSAFLGGDEGRGLTLHIGPDPLNAGRFTEHIRARPVLAGRYFPGTPVGMRGDWAVLELDDCVGRRYGYLPVADDGEVDRPPAGPLMTVSFPRDKRRPGVAVEAGCRARENGPVFGLVGVDCAFGAGMSGGPVLERQSDGQWKVIGLIQLRHAPTERVLPAYSHRHRNQMLHAATFVRQVQQLIGQRGTSALPRSALPTLVPSSASISANKRR
ncbi:trypsin-like serine peptidase [Thauera humireducens]|uniref:trypsin-like serine peptidase n=1 Tax=Thauera humireducens TaxID=1134435 RepID=UPI0012E7AB81|nr:serine protease [Thauera humireducens]